VSCINSAIFAALDEASAQANWIIVLSEHRQMIDAGIFMAGTGVTNPQVDHGIS
jgi:hypothetical protein